MSRKFLLKAFQYSNHNSNIDPFNSDFFSTLLTSPSLYLFSATFENLLLYSPLHPFDISLRRSIRLGNVKHRCLTRIFKSSSCHVLLTYILVLTGNPLCFPVSNIIIIRIITDYKATAEMSLFVCFISLMDCHSSDGYVWIDIIHI